MKNCRKKERKTWTIWDFFFRNEFTSAFILAKYEKIFFFYLADLSRSLQQTALKSFIVLRLSLCISHASMLSSCFSRTFWGVRLTRLVTLFIAPAGFWPRKGTLGFPACIHPRIKKFLPIFIKSTYKEWLYRPAFQCLDTLYFASLFGHIS